MRVFVALDIPEPVRAAIGALAAKLRGSFPHARWVRIEGMHVTLKFIGEAPPEKVESIKAALAAAPVSGPIRMDFRGVGFFPDARRPRVFWVGIEADAKLGELAAGIELALEPLGIPRERRAFSPHLTLARFEPSRGTRGGAIRFDSAIAHAGALEFGHDVAKEFHLYQSVLKSGGAEYTRLASFALAGSPSR